MNLNKLIPNLYNNNIEMNELINSENIEFTELLTTEIKTAFNNNFIATANDEGLTKFENLLGLPIMTLDDLEDKSEENLLNMRRVRLWNRLNYSPVYTENWLKAKLDEILKPGNWRYEISYNDYTLDIYSLRPGKFWLKELIAVLEKIMPCNIVWTIHIYTLTWQAVFEHVETWKDLYELDLTWQEVMEGEWIDEQ